MAHQFKPRAANFTGSESPGPAAGAQSGTLPHWAGTAAFLTPGEAAAYLRVSKGYLAKLRVEGGGPRFVRLAARVILYRPIDLLAYAESRLRSSTSDTGGEGNND